MTEAKINMLNNCIFQLFPMNSCKQNTSNMKNMHVWLDSNFVVCRLNLILKSKLYHSPEAARSLFILLLSFQAYKVIFSQILFCLLYKHYTFLIDQSNSNSTSLRLSKNQLSNTFRLLLIYRSTHLQDFVIQFPFCALKA